MTSPNIDALAPADLARYLASTGWTQRQQEPHLSLWSTEDDGFEVLLPLDADFRDYRARLLDALATIALAEERPAADVLVDVTATKVDAQHFRLLPDTPSGTIPLIDIVDIARGVRDLMFTAAHATVLNAPVLVQPRPRPPQVNAFVRSVLLAAPTPGSFVLSAHVPVRDGAAVLPFNRRVVLQLHRAVQAVHAAATQAARGYSTTPFLERAEHGVSANLCAAVGLIGETQPFDLRFAWAGSIPARPSVSHFSFDHRLISVVRAAARDLPRHAAEAQVVVTARVVQLDRAAQGDGRATLRGSVDDGRGHVTDVTATAALPPALYDRAVAAHRERRQVRVVGNLRGTELAAVASLDIIDS